ncbi:hypothetical protein ODZ83_07155 [Acaricomes phytoseiuli]|uniref:hypothetical protein n=1 Tax=Acaricomes phytoseiuli TaxID=291968 RepID=UPI0022239D0A|nr:hypothetical protein [Acaricomes phytoseiuli]MCW1249963.1 hypothetical protein [Acaricomes phytoseiuli]
MVDAPSVCSCDDFLEEAANSVFIDVSGFNWTPLETAEESGTTPERNGCQLTEKIVRRFDDIIRRITRGGRLIYVFGDGKFAIIELGTCPQASAGDLPGPQPASRTLHRAQAAREHLRDAAADLLALNLTAQDCLVLLGANSAYTRTAMASIEQHGALAVTELLQFDTAEQQLLANAIASVLAQRSGLSVQLEYRDLGVLDEQSLTAAQRTVMIATGLSKEHSAAALAAAGGSARAAIIAVLADIPPQLAQQMISVTKS